MMHSEMKKVSLVLFLFVSIINDSVKRRVENTIFFTQIIKVYTEFLIKRVFTCFLMGSVNISKKHLCTFIFLKRMYLDLFDPLG